MSFVALAAVEPRAKSDNVLPAAAVREARLLQVGADQDATGEDAIIKHGMVEVGVVQEAGAEIASGEPSSRGSKVGIERIREVQPLEVPLLQQIRRQSLIVLQLLQMGLELRPST
jgi:hypothetical protein